MNFKTTLGMAIVLVVVIGAVLTFSRKDGRSDDETNVVQTLDQPRPLFDPEPTALVRVEMQRKDRDKLILVRTEPGTTPSNAVWELEEPVKGRVYAWQINTICNRVGRLKYRQKSGGGSKVTVTPETAGLNPPQATITLTDESGKTYGLEIGQSVLGKDTFVRLLDDDAIYVVTSQFDDLLQKKPDEYRDRKVLQAKKSDVKFLEVVYKPADRPEERYQLAKADGEWLFKVPFDAYAETAKIDAVVNQFCNLQVSKWLEDGGSPADYGLTEPVLSVKITTEKTEPVTAKDESQEEGVSEEPDAEEESEPQTVSKTYEIQFSDRSPFGDDGAIYAKCGDSDIAFVLRKTTYKVFVPKSKEWRDMRLFRESFTCSRIEMQHDDKTVTLEKQNGKWTVASLDVPAEQSIVGDLISRIRNLKALNFVNEPEKGKDYGFGKPRSIITITAENKPDPIRLYVGDFTDSNARELAYCRVGDGAIAKVFVSAFETVGKDASYWRTRRIFDFAASSIEGIKGQRKRKDNDEYVAFDIVRRDNEWKMIAPVESGVNTAGVDTLTAGLASLQADDIVEDKTPEDLGLDKPTIEFEITVEGTPIFTVPNNEDSSPMVETTEPKTYTLQISRQKSKLYARRSDVDLLYQLDIGLKDTFYAEVRSLDVMNFSPSQVTALTVGSGGEKSEFIKEDDQWVYAPEKDLPIDKHKVEAFLRDLSSLQAVRYVRYKDANLDDFGFKTPTHEHAITLDDGTTMTLLVSAKQDDSNSAGNRYASVKGTGSLFLISPENCNKLSKKRPDFGK